FHDSLRYYTPFGFNWNVTSVAIGNGTVWFGLAGGGVKQYNVLNSRGNLWTSFRTPTLSSDFVFAIAVDATGDFYVGTPKGADRFIPNGSDPTQGIWIKYTSANSPLPDEQIRTIGISPIDNLIWFGTQSHG